VEHGAGTDQGDQVPDDKLKLVNSMRVHQVAVCAIAADKIGT